METYNSTVTNALAKLNIEALNDMQIAALNAAEKHKNLQILSATGSGKTIAFLLPLLPVLQSEGGTTKALVIVPSRELALQIEKVFKQMGTGIKITCCYGGHKRETEENNLIEAPAIIVGTPGRLADHIRRGNITLASIEAIVLDEFDKSLELGFQDEMEFIIHSLPAVDRRILTSATEAVAIPAFIGFDNAERVNFLSSNAVANEALTIQSVYSPDKDKLNTLFKLLCYVGARPSIIFCNHRESVERTSSLLTQKGINNQFYHGAMEQQERDSALCKFRNGTTHFLVTTDLAARGLDIPFIRYIIHYHLPHTEDIFIHRNGRTARMEASGTAIVILSEEEQMPRYVTDTVKQITLPLNDELPEQPKWSTLFIAAGKKDKVNKIDIVGFLSNRGQLKKDEIGLIEVKDFFSFVAIKKSKVGQALQLIKNEKIKNKNVKIEVAK